MSFFDMSIDELQAYQPERHEPADFDTFWSETLSEAREHSLEARFEAVNFGLKAVETYDVTFAGYGGHPIKAWLMLPANADAPLPCVVQYIGYTGGRGFPYDRLSWAVAGYAHLVVDTRGQVGGDTTDITEGGSPNVAGFLTQGVLDPKTYYYRRVYTDAVRAIEAARSHDKVDETRIAVAGASQGGGITIAVSGLMPDVALSLPDVPFLCQFRRSVGLTPAMPYREISSFLAVQRDKVETVFNTLDYFDAVNFAARIQAPSLFSTALMDQICAPSTVFAAYNQIDAPKDIKIYDYNGHEGGGHHHFREKINFVNNHWR